MTLTQFRTRFPEFKLIGDEMVKAFMADAALELDANVLGTKYDAAQGYLAAHKLALSPAGVNARLSDSKDGTTTYSRHFKAIIRKSASGFRVV